MEPIHAGAEQLTSLEIGQNFAQLDSAPCIIFCSELFAYMML